VPSPESESLSQFREFIYRSYGQTHPVFGAMNESDIGREAQVAALLRKALPSNKKAQILDFGCGDGLLLSVAQKLGYSELTGVDLSDDLLAKAARRSSANFQRADGLEFLRASANDSFDVVIAFDVFEHFTRPELLETTREIHRVLKPGGRLLLMVPNGASPRCGEVFWGDLTHERPYTKFSLAQVLLPLGFDDIQAAEVTPAPHGLKSAIRSVLWQFIRAWTVLQLAVETGKIRGHTLTINIFVTARKATRKFQPL
jgi:SAM-dependent methyltransferase